MFVLFADNAVLACGSFDDVEHAMFNEQELDEYRSYKSDMYRAPKYEIVECSDVSELPCCYGRCPFSEYNLLNNMFQSTPYSTVYSDGIPF